jgi:C-terminal processing protease CtpA/Prc
MSKQMYYWNTHVPSLDYGSYQTEEELLDALIYKQYDRWSYIANKTTHDQYYSEGQYHGFGFAIGEYADNNSSFTISLVYPNSPADHASLQRGVKVTHLNNQTITLLLDTESLDDMLDNETLLFTYLDLSNSEHNVTIQKDTVSTQSVFYSNIYNAGAKKVGYFVFNSFITPSYTQLDTLFADFVAQNVDEVIIDLRFNGGGSVDVATYLATYLGGTRVTSRLFGTMIHNANESSRNKNLYFYQTSTDYFDHSRVIVLTSASTCSASELVINALKPYNIDLVTIGDTTCGKPVGMYGLEFCNKILSQINFRIDNADGDGEYFDGISPTCTSEDNLSIALGDTNETLLSYALYYIQNNACRVGGASIRSIENKALPDTILKGIQKEIGAL